MGDEYIWKKGSILHKSSPFLAMLTKDHVLTHCSYCFKKLNHINFRGCTKCTVANYCSKECSDRNEIFHQLECKMYGKSLPTFDAVRMMIRLLHKLNQQDGHDDYDPVIKEGAIGCKIIKRRFRDLLSHREEMMNDPLTFHAIKGVHQMAKDYMGLENVPDISEFAEIYGKMAINGFEICDEMSNNRAWGIYLGASVVDHSCCPNAHVVFEGRNLIIRALEDIQSCSHDQGHCQMKNSLDLAQKVHISYIDVMEHTLVRQQKLSAQYYFICQCNRCLGKQLTWKKTCSIINQEEDYRKLEDMMYSIRCQDCAEGQLVVVGPGSCIEELNPQECHGCSGKPKEKTLEAYLAIKSRVEKMLEDNNLKFGEPLKAVELMTGFFYPYHILYVKASELAFEDCLHSRKWEEAIDYGSLCLSAYKKFTIGDQIWGNLGLISYRMAYAFEKLGPSNAENMEKMLAQSLRSLSITHGQVHPLVQEVKRRLTTESEL